MDYDFKHKKTGKILAPENYFKLPESERKMYEICDAELNYKNNETNEIISISDYLALPQSECSKYTYRPLKRKYVDTPPRLHESTTYEKREKKDSSGDFLTSAVIGAVTGSAILGGLFGGDMLGGILGDSLDGDLMD